MFVFSYDKTKQKRQKLRQKQTTKPWLVAFYDIWAGNGVDLFL